ncbi:unnamed protein product [Ilex paraguariensis]|uniref:Golgin candidate 4 n=1 Tax=Ilex paraguariensis TaxID=185542 RepID=A0ABC8QPA0_9AQUA
MMWNTIANLKENLNKIVLDVHEDDDVDELAMYNSRDGEDSSVADRRISHNFAHSKSPSSSPLANGFDSAYNSEIEQYKAEIKRLQESEAEIKALSVNYAALLKEKEDQISRLNEEKGSLKQNLDATNAALCGYRNESFKTPVNSPNVLKGSSDQLSNRQHKAVMKNSTNGVVSKQDRMSNGSTHYNMQGNIKELADLLEEKNKSLAEMQATHELQIKQLGVELDQERGKLANVHLRLQEEQKLNESFQQELNSLKVDRDNTFTEMEKTRDELDKRISDIKRLEMELHRRDNEEADDEVESLKRRIATLEMENSSLKVEKDGLEAALRVASNSSGHKISDGTSNKNSNSLNGTALSEGFLEKEEMELSLQKLKSDLKETRNARDKALQELSRLKQHLLEKESEESEKMDEDSKIIEQLRENNEYQRTQILRLEKALKQAITSQDEVRMINNHELQKSKEIIDDLNRKLANSTSIIEAKNLEVLNLQTALGQYYAEMEAKDRLAEDVTVAREQSSRLSELLKDAHQQAEVSEREKEEILAKLSQAERTLAEGKNRLNKLEEDNEKLRRALEQSMTRLNRMSMDSDFFVDRRIVIKLLVTYFQRNHSKEVLDLMVRMLGFSDEEKLRIGLAQHGAGKGVVRGVLGLPGRLVGGILGGGGGGSAEVPANMASDKQSFGDLWVDFLLKEAEEREKRESAEAVNGSKADQQKGSPNGKGAAASSLPDNTTNATAAASGFSRSNPFLDHNRSPLSRGDFLHSGGHSDLEFSTVSLTSSENSSQISRFPPRY